MKVGKHIPAHTVPLSRQARELLDELHNLTGHTAYLFPKAKGYGENEVISENTVGRQLNNLGYQGPSVRTRPPGVGAVYPERAGLERGSDGAPA